ncbi:MAG: class D sortase [Candidatus Korobacteraceae bacterium]
MQRNSTFRGFSRLERVLLFCGILLVSVYIGSRFYGAVYSRSSLESFWTSQAVAQTVLETTPHSRSGLPDFRLWSEKRIQKYQASLLVKVPPPLGVIEIPSLRLQVPILEGTDDLTLDRGVGHIAGTASPGEPGNIGVAGHRDGFFRGLKDIHVGDTIDIESQQGNSHYRVDEIQIVSPDDVSVLRPRTKPSLTLVTCYPFYFVGSAPSRYIVHATLANANDLKSSETLVRQAKPQVDGRANQPN